MSTNQAASFFFYVLQIQLKSNYIEMHSSLLCIKLKLIVMDIAIAMSHIINDHLHVSQSSIMCFFKKYMKKKQISVNL